MTKFLVRYAKFAGTSVVGSIVDTLVLWLLSDLIFTRGYWGEYIISPLISFQCAVAVNYMISYFYVWKDRTRKRPDASARSFFKLYGAYNLSNSAVLLFRLGILQTVACQITDFLALSTLDISTCTAFHCSLLISVV